MLPESIGVRAMQNGPAKSKQYALVWFLLLHHQDAGSYLGSMLAQFAFMFKHHSWLIEPYDSSL